MSCKTLISERLYLTVSQKISISDLLCLSNNRIFIYFNSGRYQHWNLKSENEKTVLLHEGKIDIKIYNLQALSDTRIFYINLKKKCFEVFDLETYTIINHFTSLLPTTLVFSSSHRDSSGEEIMKFETDVLTLRDSQTIVVLEQNKYEENQKLGVTVFNEEACKKQGFVQQFLLSGEKDNSNRLLLSKINDIDTIVLYYQFNDSDLPKIWLVNVLNQYVRIISLSNALQGTIMDVKSWESNKLSIWMNYDESDQVKVAIIDYEKAKITKESQSLVELVCISQELRTLDEGTVKSHLLMNVIDVDYSQGIALLMLDVPNVKTRIFLYDTNTLNETFQKIDFLEEEANYSNSISIDKNYFVEFLKDEREEEQETIEEWSYSIVYSRMIASKNQTTSLKEESDILEKLVQSSGEKA